jgi:hypothetical protein
LKFSNNFHDRLPRIFSQSGRFPLLIVGAQHSFWPKKPMWNCDSTFLNTNGVRLSENNIPGWGKLGFAMLPVLDFNNNLWLIGITKPSHLGWFLLGTWIFNRSGADQLYIWSQNCWKCVSLWTVWSSWLL